MYFLYVHVIAKIKIVEYLYEYVPDIGDVLP